MTTDVFPIRMFATNKTVASYDPQFAYAIHCPRCGFDYTHTTDTPVTEDAKDNYEASWQGRGDLLRVPFLCENGHEFELCFGFHKGQTLVFARLP
jgi:hypothetical protein